MTRDEFDSHFTSYRVYLREEIHRFIESVSVYRTIQEQTAVRLYAINLAPAFFGVVEDSLFTTIVMWGDKLFDERGERGFFNFLKFIEHERKWLSVSELQRRKNYSDDHSMLKGRIPITFESIEEDRARVRSLNVLNNLKLRRDKFHGHFDKEYFFDRKRLQTEAPITWQDLEEAGTLMGSLLNDYSVDFDGVSFSWITQNITDLEVLLMNVPRGGDAAA